MLGITRSAIFFIIFDLLRIVHCEEISLELDPNVEKQRQKRDLGVCSWGATAVSGCFAGGYCNLGYQCDLRAGGDGAGRCCLRNGNGAQILGNWPNYQSTSLGLGGSSILGACSWGAVAVAACFTGGWCGRGYRCDRQAGRDGRGRCCRYNGIEPQNGGTAALIIIQGSNVAPGFGGTTVGGLLDRCFWGQAAVSFCSIAAVGVNGANQYLLLCNSPYECDPFAGNDGRGRCCLRNGIALGTGGTINGGTTIPGAIPGGTTIPAAILGGTPFGVQLGQCSWGQPAVSVCNVVVISGINQLQCTSPLECDTLAGNDGRGRCCLRNTVVPGVTTTPTRCPNNAPTNSQSCSVDSPCQPGYLCIRGFCCLQSSLRCNNGVTVPVGTCMTGQCLPQATPEGVFRPERCEEPDKLCCPL